MKITKLTLENFKSVGTEVSIDFKPITLLFGPNSVGKSTILQALQYLREVLEFRNFNSDRTQSGGNLVDLGGFANIVHRHDLGREIRIRMEITLDDDGLPLFGPEVNSPELYESIGGGFISEANLQQVERLYAEVSIGSDKDQGLRVTRYEVGLNGQRFAELSVGPHDRPYLSFLDMDAWLKPDDPEDSQDGYQIQEFKEQMNWNFEKLNDGETPEVLNLDTSWTMGVIPNWHELLPLQLGCEVPYETQEWAGPPAIVCLLSRAMVGGGALVLRELQRSRYLGPIREVPPRNYTPQLSPDSGRWASGLAAWDVLHQLNNEHIRKNISQWLEDPEKVDLGMGYNIRMLEYFEIPTDSTIIRAAETVLGASRLGEDEEVWGAWGELLDDELAEFTKTSKQRLIITDLKRGVEVSLQDVGTGVAQVIPVSVGAVYKGCSFFSVEQPELHIHPRIQCQLGDVFAKEAGLDDDRVFIIETHSEHLILRLLRRIRETSEASLPPGAPSLKKEHVAVYYLNQNIGELEVTGIPATDDGDFDAPWPEGFFDERDSELF